MCWCRREISSFAMFKTRSRKTAKSPLEKTRAGRFSFVVFTLRVADDQFKLRPISARYMHKKEIAKYEKEIAGL